MSKEILSLGVMPWTFVLNVFRIGYAWNKITVNSNKSIYSTYEDIGSISVVKKSKKDPLFILFIALGAVVYQAIKNSEYREIENQLLPKAKQYNGVDLYLDKQIGQELYLSITFESTGNKELDIDYLTNLSKIAVQTPAEELFIWVHKEGTPTESIYMDRRLIENWLNENITRKQFVSGWDIADVTLE